MMKRKVGKRHSLLFYTRTMGRILLLAFYVLLLLMAFLIWSELKPPGPLGEISAVLFLACLLATMVIGLFAFFSRWMAYAQACQNYIKFVTPFLNLKVAYSRVRSVHPVLIQQVYPKESLRWADAKFIEPFLGKTAIAINFRDYPVSPRLLRLFLPRTMFYPATPGFIILVPDWMELSTELDTLMGNWRHNQKVSRQVSLVN